MNAALKSARERLSPLVPIFAAIALTALLRLLFMGLAGLSFTQANPYNSYALQAQAWLNGQLDLGQDYLWLELAIFQGRYYVSFPPFPSYVLLPFALIFGAHTPDSLIAFFITLLGVYYAGRIALYFCKNKVEAFLLPLFFYCGTAIWQVTVDGSVWFFAQNLALTLTFASLYYSAKGKRGRALFCLVAAVGCRPFQIIAFPLVLWLLYRQAKGETFRQKLVQLFFCKVWVWLPCILLASSFLWLNFARFGDPLEFGHNYLPEFIQAADGQFSGAYFFNNLPSLWRLPTFDAQTHQLCFPWFDGMNIFIAFPILVWYLYFLLQCIVSLRRQGILNTASTKLIYTSGFTLFLFSLQTAFFLFHRTMGGHHYGNRYVGDGLPLIFFGLCLLYQSFDDPLFSKVQTKQSFFSWSLFFGLFLSGFLLSTYGVMQFFTA